MKKYILALALLFICHIGFAQNLNSLFDEFGKEPNAECINISPFMMTIGKMLWEMTTMRSLPGNLNQ